MLQAAAVFEFEPDAAAKVGWKFRHGLHFVADFTGQGQHRLILQGLAVKPISLPATIPAAKAPQIGVA